MPLTRRVARARPADLGRAIAATLSGTWRADLPPMHPLPLWPSEADAAADILPLLLKCGSASLAWRRWREATPGSIAGAGQLQRTHRLQALQAAVQNQSLIRLMRFLRATGIEPILGKGWAIARLYPDAGLRPYGDIDLFVHPAAYHAAYAALRQPGMPSAPVDLHCGTADLDDRPFGVLQARSTVQPLGDVTVRVFGAEDHLRLLCLHMLRHGAWRPLWLVDVAVALESRPADFDWDYFLEGDPRQTAWAVSAIGIAHHLLGANVHDTPIEGHATSVPRWLIPAVLNQWGCGKPLPQQGRRLQSYWRDRAGLVEAVLTRWPNAIQATVAVHGAFNEWPRWPFQIGDCLRRTCGLMAQLVR